MEETAVPENKSSADKKKKDERDAKILWYLMMALRVVIPAYMLYVVYLYWTIPLSPYLQDHGNA
jgi:predicted nucleic acid-binding Zn ribbon protein